MKAAARIAIFAGALIAAIGVIVLTPGNHRVLIAGDKPVTEDQVRAKLTADGYSDIRISQDGRWLDVTAIRDGKKVDLSVNSENGRLADEPFKDADDHD